MFDDSAFAIDSSKFKAVNNKAKNYTPRKVQFHIGRAESSMILGNNVSNDGSNDMHEYFFKDDFKS
jgi:hypothetical protein